MSLYNFDEIVPRRGSYSAKWTVYPEDVLPLWVADMDFVSPREVIERLHQRVDEGVFGYTMDSPELRESLVERMKTLYQWEIHTEDLVFIPGMVLALNLVASVVGKPGDGILMQTPVYGPFLSIPPERNRFAVTVDLAPMPTGKHTFTYAIDFKAFEKAITRQTSLFYLCNPHNPAGRAMRREELEELAELCLKNHITICSDEIHCDLLIGNAKHIPIASLSPEIARQTITLMAPSKTFNMPGLGCSVAIVQNKDLRRQLENAARGMGVHVNLMGLEAATAAYQHGDVWLKEVLAYLKQGRDKTVSYIEKNIPVLKTTVPEATYLMWIDARDLPLPPEMSAYDFFLKEAKVALNPGTFFGTGYENYVRLNFAAPHQIVQEALERMKEAVGRL
jgi:cystathionine beta-lyase